MSTVCHVTAIFRPAVREHPFMHVYYMLLGIDSMYDKDDKIITRYTYLDYNRQILYSDTSLSANPA